MDVIDGWELYYRLEREKAHAAFTADPGYPALVEEAKTRGFRPCSMEEIHESADVLGDPNTYCWRGGLWKRTS